MTLTRDELETLQDWATGETREIRKWAGQDLDRRKADGVLSQTAQHIMGVICGPTHKVRRQRAGRRLAFSAAYLIATANDRRVAAGRTMARGNDPTER